MIYEFNIKKLENDKYKIVSTNHPTGIEGATIDLMDLEILMYHPCNNYKVNIV